MVDTPDGVHLSVWVQPGARRSECAGFHDGAVKLRVVARPQDGAATTEAIELLARLIGVRVTDVRLLRGRTSRRKVVKIRGATADAVRRRLETAIGK